MRYYFVTYQATNKQGSVSIWNQAIDCSPMQFINHVMRTEESGSNTYQNFVIINTLRITKKEFKIWDGMF